MKTLFELHKDNHITVFHWTEGGQTKVSHPIEEPCEHCPANIEKVRSSTWRTNR
jgi:hypothetical protein